MKRSISKCRLLATVFVTPWIIFASLTWLYAKCIYFIHTCTITASTISAYLGVVVEHPWVVNVIRVQ